MNPQTPSHLQLVELWLQTHFQGRPAAVFFDPCGEGDRIPKIAKRLGMDLHQETCIEMIPADIYVHRLTVDSDVASLVNPLDEDTFGFVVGWDGHQIVTENT